MTKTDIKNSILEELNKQNMYKPYLVDLVDDYMKMWDTKEALQRDIKENGVKIIYNNGGGQCGVKKNDSVEQLIKMNAQMLKLLDALGIKPNLIPQGEIEFDDKL